MGRGMQNSKLVKDKKEINLKIIMHQSSLVFKKRPSKRSTRVCNRLSVRNVIIETSRPRELHRVDNLAQVVPLFSRKRRQGPFIENLHFFLKNCQISKCLK